MQGTEEKPARCVALRGELGKTVNCSIYENRSSSCRNFKASFEDGFINRACDEARLAINRSPLTRKDWIRSTPVQSPNVFQRTIQKPVIEFMSAIEAANHVLDLSAEPSEVIELNND